MTGFVVQGHILFIPQFVKKKLKKYIYSNVFTV